MTMFTRRRGLIGAAAAVALGLTMATTAGAAPRQAQADPVTISFLTHWPPDVVAQLEAAAAKYTAANPNVKVEIKAVPFGDLLTTVRAQSGSTAPTIAGIYDLWLPELVRDGMLATAPEALAADVAAKWSAGPAAAATVDGKVYGVPNEIDLYALNYNKKLFAEAGIAEAPKTWAELVDAATKLTKTENGKITQQGIGFINSWAAGTVHPFASLLASNGGALVTDGKASLDTKQATETFELYQQLFATAKTSDATMGTADANTTGPFLDNFVSGKTAMIIMANWWESALKSGMGETAFADIATAPIPAGPSGDGPHSISYSWMTVVSAQASEAEQAAAWDFLNWLNGPDSGTAGVSAMGELLSGMGILPSRTSDIDALKDKLSEPFLEGYVTQLANAKPFPIVLGGQELTEAVQKQIEALQFGQVDAKGAQDTAQSDAVSILEAAAQG